MIRPHVNTVKISQSLIFFLFFIFYLMQSQTRRVLKGTPIYVPCITLTRLFMAVFSGSISKAGMSHKEIYHYCNISRFMSLQHMSPSVLCRPSIATWYFFFFRHKCIFSPNDLNQYLFQVNPNHPPGTLHVSCQCLEI